SDDGQADRLLQALIHDAGTYEAKSIETRDWPEGLALPSRLGQNVSSSTHVIPIHDGIQVVARSVSRNTRRSLQRAATNEIEVAVRTDRQGVEIFYDLYLQQRRRQRLLPQPRAFVRSLYEHMV